VIPLVAHPETHTEAGLFRCPVQCANGGHQCPNPTLRGEPFCGAHKAKLARLTTPPRRPA
jgi:hypothetical protein